MLLFVELGSLVVDEIVEFAVIVLAVTVAATLTTTMMSADAPEARLGSVQTTEAPFVQDQPTGAETETNVVLVGMISLKLTAEAVAGPLLVMV